ncbi:MAG: hypothetical protein ABJC62_04525 [Frankiaceae bacterium]
MPITVFDVPAWADEGLDVPQPTDSETARMLGVLVRHRHDVSPARPGLSDPREELIAPEQAQPWDF